MASSARIDELRKKFDENPRRYFAPLANEYRKAGDLEQAIFICQEYLPQQPGHMSGHIVYGQALFEQNRHEEAKTVFETALSLDPENLIALRHLGDIARTSGDAANARIWYQRVLEADPRNEEIAQLMLSLLAAAPTPAPSAPAVDHSAPTPLTNPAVPATPSAGQLGADASDASGTFGVEKAPDLTLGAPALHAVPDPAEIIPPPPAAAAPPRLEIDPRDYTSRHAPKEDELLDLDSFDLGGVPLSSLRTSAAVPVQPEERAEQTIELSESMPSLETPDAGQSGGESFSEGLELDSVESHVPDAQTTTTGLFVERPSAGDAHIGEAEAAVELDAPFEADPFAITASTSAPQHDDHDEHIEQVDEGRQAPVVELATDVSLGLPEDGVSSSFVEGGESLDGLESFEAGIIPNAPRDTIAIDAGSFYDMAAADAAPASDPGAALENVEEFESAPIAEPAAAFVTETMATLYLQQGHLDSALDIYRQLVAQRPEDAALRERMAAVESQLASAAAVAAAPEPFVEETTEPLVAPQSYGGPTIREFLSGLMTRRVMVTEIPPVEPEPVEAVPPEEPPVVEEPESKAEITRDAARPTPSSSETVGGSLDMLFSGADAAANDAHAARTLADAFAPDTPETSPLQGMPAHRASSELSLNHVFKGSTPQRVSTETDAFSFDQFFTENAAEGTPGPDAEGSPATPAEGADDIAQFNAWLNGLKKT